MRKSVHLVGYSRVYVSRCTVQKMLKEINKFYNPFVLHYAHGALLQTCMWTTLSYIHRFDRPLI